MDFKDFLTLLTSYANNEGRALYDLSELELYELYEQAMLLAQMTLSILTDMEE